MEPSLGRTKSKPVAVVSRKAFVSAPKLACEEVYEFKEKLKETQPLAIEIPAPMVKKQEGERENRKEPKGTASGSNESKMVVYDEGETAEIEQPDPKRAKPETASAGLPEM